MQAGGKPELKVFAGRSHPDLAEAIQRIHTGGSVSALFR